MKKLAIPVLMILTAFAGAVAQTPKKPKNIIIMIADGWGYNQIKAADYFLYGADSAVYEKFPVKLFDATYPAVSSEYNKKSESNSAYDKNTGYDPQKAWSDFEYVKHGYTESAAAATALAAGVKTYNGAIGVDTNKVALVNASQQAKQLGKSVGLITTVSWVDATPAGFCAHNHNRKHYDEIAFEMLALSTVDVIIGAGNPYYDNDGNPVSKDKAKFDLTPGKENMQSLTSGDTMYMIPQEKRKMRMRDIDGDSKADPWHFSESYDELKQIIAGQNIPKRLCFMPKAGTTFREGRSLPAPGAKPFEGLRPGIPTLAECVLGSLSVLARNPEGFFVMAEGGAVDWANHDNRPERMIEEMSDFNNAVDTVLDWITAHGGFEENLLIVCGDHECGYLTGPKDNDNSPLTNPIVSNGKGVMPGLKYNSKTHTNSLIPLFAVGCGSELLLGYADKTDPVRGKYIQNTDVAKLIFSLWGKTAEHVWWQR